MFNIIIFCKVGQKSDNTNIDLQ